MPFVDHNEPWILENIKTESERTKDLLRKLRHVVEQGHLQQEPHDLVSKLGLHAGLLARSIQQYTIRHDFLEREDGPLHHSEYEGVMQFVEGSAREHPEYIHVLPAHAGGPDEYRMYRDELGFSEQEYRDLLVWKKALDVDQMNPAGAFDVFSSGVIAELQAGRYSIAPADIVPGVAGIVGIAADVAFFNETLAVPALVASCTTGLAAIASKFEEVKRKLLGRGFRW